MPRALSATKLSFASPLRSDGLRAGMLQANAVQRGASGDEQSLHVIPFVTVVIFIKSLTTKGSFLLKKVLI